MAVLSCFLLLFSVLFLIFPNTPFWFLTVDEDLGDIFKKQFPTSLSQPTVNFTVCLQISQGAGVRPQLFNHENTANYKSVLGCKKDDCCQNLIFTQLHWRFYIGLGFVIPEISHNKYVRQCKCFPWPLLFQLFWFLFGFDFGLVCCFLLFVFLLFAWLVFLWVVDYFNRTLVLTRKSFRKEFIQ